MMIAIMVVQFDPGYYPDELLGWNNIKHCDSENERITVFITPRKS